MPPLPVTYIQQLPGLCGAACAQMILNAQPVTGIGTTEADQKQLWIEIKNITTVPKGVTTVAGENDNSACEPFARKICECPKNRFCWCTFPTALQAILRVHSPGVSTRVITSRLEPSINAKIALCIDKGVAPAILVENATHWVVVRGFDPTSADAVDLLDPDFDSEQILTISHWNTYYLDKMTCGKYKGKYVVVGRDA